VRRRIEIAAVVLPVLLLGLMIGRAEWQLAHSRTWHFAIRGYDPRDLLRGHYMRFRLELPVAETIESCSVASGECCYCLEPSNEVEPRITLARCETARDVCDAFVDARALQSLDRFYIPEEGRGEMERVLRAAAVEDRAHLAVAVSRTGEPMIEALLIDGVPIRVAAEDEIRAAEEARAAAEAEARAAREARDAETRALREAGEDGAR